MARSIQDISNKSFSAIRTDFTYGLQLLDHLVAGRIIIEDPIIEDSVRSKDNYEIQRNFLHLLCRLGAINHYQIGEIRSCMEFNDTMSAYNTPTVDTLGGIQIKTASLRYSTYGKRFYYAVEFTGKEMPELLHMQCTHNGVIKGEAKINLRENPCGSSLSVTADRFGNINKSGKWGRFFS
jgi:hypothetical protein